MASSFGLALYEYFVTNDFVVQRTSDPVFLSSDDLLFAIVIGKIATLMAYLVAGCWWDYRKHVIPNGLNYLFLLIAIGLAAAVSAVQMLYPNARTTVVDSLMLGLGESTAGVAICFLFTFLCWRFGALGGGDVKLAAVIGAFLGPWGGIMALVICHLLAMVTVTLDLVSRHMKAIRLRQLPTYSELQGDLKRQIPMAGFYAVGVLGFLLGGFM